MEILTQEAALPTRDEGSKGRMVGGPEAGVPLQREGAAQWDRCPRSWVQRRAAPAGAAASVGLP